jgi:hypothetical protein
MSVELCELLGLNKNWIFCRGSDNMTNYVRINYVHTVNINETDNKSLKNIMDKYTIRDEPHMKSKYTFLSEPQDEFKHILINSSNKEYKQENKHKQNKLKIGRQQNHKKINATSRAPNRRSTWFN